MFLSFQIYRDALHWRRKCVLCVGVCLITVKQDRVACICEGILKMVAKSNVDLDMLQRIQRGRLFVQEKRIWTAKISDASVERVRKKILQSLKKLLRRTSPVTQIPLTTVCRILRKRLTMKPYKLQLVQAITAEDKHRRKPS